MLHNITLETLCLQDFAGPALRRQAAFKLARDTLDAIGALGGFAQLMQLARLGPALQIERRIAKVLKPAGLAVCTRAPGFRIAENGS